MAAATKDAILISAVDQARQVAIEAAENPAHVGEHLGAVVEGERLVSHQFACTAPGYRGWHWTVTLARVPRARVATVCEAELLPGDDAILAPSWLPWSERLRPGDIGPGDVLPFLADDPRLVPGYVATGDEDEDRVAIEELALARARLLSREGRDRAAERWYAGSQGPTSPTAVAASAACLTCAFMIPLSGPLGQLFGVCANEWSPDDAKVVSLDHGCGAHSETDLEPHPSDWPASGPKFDDMDLELVSMIVEEPTAIPEEPRAEVPAEDVVAAPDAPEVVEPEGEVAAEADADAEVAVPEAEGEGEVASPEAEGEAEVASPEVEGEAEVASPEVDAEVSFPESTDHVVDAVAVESDTFEPANPDDVTAEPANPEDAVDVPDDDDPRSHPES
ncbi:DUF3027 domain-containing protein [Pengzhenrongella sp.]|uniref:DUF3027 domain-containing protein n=1 Tax=Pengzhenrongella sp. TaxID=2888820 RepID=UPI002F95B6DA